MNYWTKPISPARDGYDWLLWPVLFVYALLTAWGSSFHEVWRDEVISMTVAIHSHSLGELLHNMKNFGHPALWFVILHYAYHIFPHYCTLKIVNWGVNVLAAYVFLKKAPFPWPLRILFLVGFFPFYYFPLVNRNYGLSWLFFLLFCTLYAQRWKKVLLVGAVLFLLAETHAEGTILSTAILSVMTAEFIFNRELVKRQQGSLKAIIPAGLMVLAGIAMAIIQVRTDASSSIFSWSSLSVPKIAAAIVQAVFNPGHIFSRVFTGERHAVLDSLGILGGYWLLWRQWAAFSIVFLGISGLGLFFQLFYPGFSLYHESFVYMLMIFSFWVTEGRSKGVAVYWRYAFLTVILLVQAFMALYMFKTDMLYDFSSSKSFGQWIKSQPQGKDYVIMAEPDYLVESMPYYVNNRIYIPREGIFNPYTHDTLSNRSVFSLDDFLHTGEALQAKGMPVLMVMGHHLNAQGPFQIHFPYNRTFSYSPASLAAWKTKTRKAASFQGAIYYDENYDVYVLK